MCEPVMSSVRTVHGGRIRGIGSLPGNDSRSRIYRRSLCAARLPGVPAGWLWVWGVWVCLAGGSDWPEYLGDAGRSHYSGLRQIHRRNVHRLQVAWVYRTGDAQQDPPSQIQCNPLIVDGVLYGTSPGLKLFALDAATGGELWRFDPCRRVCWPRVAGSSGVWCSGGTEPTRGFFTWPGPTWWPWTHARAG
jgi:hypothetical protein